MFYLKRLHVFLKRLGVFSVAGKEGRLQDSCHLIDFVIQAVSVW